MIIKPDFLKGIFVGIFCIDRGSMDIDSILDNLSEYNIPIAFVSPIAVISTKQIINAVYHYLDLQDFKRWIRNPGLRLLSLMVGERQIKDALKIGKPDDNPLIAVIIAKNEEIIRKIIEKMRKLNIKILPEIMYAKPEHFINIYKFKGNKQEILEREILEKQALLRLEIIKEV